MTSHPSATYEAPCPACGRTNGTRSGAATNQPWVERQNGLRCTECGSVYPAMETVVEPHRIAKQPQRRASLRRRTLGAIVALAKIGCGVALALFTVNAFSSRISYLPTVYSPLLGRIAKPGATFYWKIEGDGSGTWSSNGVRRSGDAPANAHGLLVLGDSYVEALHVNDQEFFGRLLEQKFRAHHIDTPVLPIGRSGASVADYIAQAPTYQRLFAPQWVVVEVGDNDFADDAWERRKPPGYAYFARSGSGALHIEATPQRDGGVTGYVSDHLPYILPAVLFLQDRSNVVQAYLKDREQPWFRATESTPSERKEPPATFTKFPVADEVEMLARAYDRHVTLLYLPPFDPADPNRKMTNEATLEAAARASGIRFVSLRSRFAAIAATGHAPYGFRNTRFNQGHWNRYGHAAAAELLFEDYVDHAVH